MRLILCGFFFLFLCGISNFAIFYVILLFELIFVVAMHLLFTFIVIIE